MLYEQALTYKRYLQIIDKLNSRQVVALNKIVDYDVFALASNGKNSVVNHTMIRGGKVVFSDNIAVTDAGLDEAQTLSSFLAEYCDMVKLCGEVCVNLPLEDATELAALMSEKCGRKIVLTCPKLQDKNGWWTWRTATPWNFLPKVRRQWTKSTIPRRAPSCSLKNCWG